MDREVERILGELEEDDLADDTIVFFYSDHGAGLPRGKRVLHDSGLHVPLLIRFPEKHRALAPSVRGTTVDRLVSFVDFPPTVFSLAGLAIPGYMQGRAFLGSAAGRPRAYVYGARDRVDEAFDLSRSVRDAPETDPWQIRNLASLPQYRPVLAQMRAEHQRWTSATLDLGFLPESELRIRSAGATPWAMARRSNRYPLSLILSAARFTGRPDAIPESLKRLRSSDAAVRYWAALALGSAAGQTQPARAQLIQALRDGSSSVRIAAASALSPRTESKGVMSVLTTDV